MASKVGRLFGLERQETVEQKSTDRLAHILEQLALRVGRLEDELIEARAVIAKLEARPTLSYKGTWQTTQEYRPGDFATFGGSLWHANEETVSRPGSGDGNWTLVAKRGRDAR